MKKRVGKSKTYFHSHGETHQTMATRAGEPESMKQAAGSRVQGWVAPCGQRQQGDCAISISKCSPHNIFGAAQVDACRIRKSKEEMKRERGKGRQRGGVREKDEEGRAVS